MNPPPMLLNRHTLLNEVICYILDRQRMAHGELVFRAFKQLNQLFSHSVPFLRPLASTPYEAHKQLACEPIPSSLRFRILGIKAG